MGSGREKRAYGEIDDTRQAAADDRFEEILDKVKAAGAEIRRDAIEPLYSGMHDDDLEIGEQRIVEFNLASFDFLIIREVKDGQVMSHGHQKTVMDLAMPRIEIRLKRKPETSDQWVNVDLDDFM